MGRTNVVLDDKLVEERQKKILERKGAVQWDGDLKGWRKGRSP